MPPPPPSTTSPTTSTPRFTPPSTILLLYPATLLLGSLFSVLSPTAQHPSPDPSSAEFSASGTPSSDPINYFARKDNIFNTYFVKIGWVWFTAAFASLLLTYPPSPARGTRQMQAVLRWTFATAAWYLVTQWFFGPAIIDRSFVITGGKCENAFAELGAVHEDKGVVGGAASAVAGKEEFGIYLTAAACKAAGGAWRGGHDVSGHVFMLVLVTAVLGIEAFGVLALRGEGESGEKGEDAESGSDVKKWTLRFVFGITGLGWWMLLMTAIWFHTWLEKANGLLIALGAIYTIYFLPRRVPAWRDVVGIPGV
ncbi:putative inositol phospholipid biosynthesis protein Scs3 [Aspergillus stella-maris]|uniref:putative inositol phospholipid biosynthesis protein Scs3 n=1 Tax=Aspergillus stella-maris TaxID=1810926 RepID=UPI003CCD84B5